MHSEHLPVILRRGLFAAVFDDAEGRVAGVGTHGELMESCPEYREIALSQLTEEELVEGGAR